MRNTRSDARSVEPEAQPEFQFHVGRAAMIAAGVMVLVSGYTTAKGLLDIVGWSQFYIVAMAAIVVQGMLAIAAWFLGKELARWVLRGRLGAGIEPPSAPLTAVTASIFLVTFVASFFFAFSFWYHELRSLSQRTEDARQLPNTFQTTVMRQLLVAVDNARESELEDSSKDRLKGTSGENTVTRVWLENLERIVRTARDARGEVQTRVNDSIKRRQNAAEEARKAQDQTNGQIRAAQRALEVAQSGKDEALKEIAAVEARLSPFDKELETLRAKRDEHEQERLKECAGIEGRKAGCETKANAAKTARDTVQRRINQIEEPLRPDRSRLANLKKKVEEADSAMAEQTRLLESFGVSRIRPPGEHAGDRNVSGIEGLAPLATQLDERRQDFVKKGTPEAYSAAVRACAPVLELLVEAKLATETLSQLSCESNGAMQRAETRPQREDARAKFAGDCSSDKMTAAARQASALIPLGEQRVDAKILANSFSTINGKIESCINIAIATGADVLEAENLRSDFARTHAPDRDRFQEALVGLWNGGAHRTAAAGIAGIFDLMILALSFFADLFNIRGHRVAPATMIRRAHIDVSPDPNDPVPLAGAKMLRRHTRYNVEMRKFVLDFNATENDELGPAIAENARMRLDSYLQAKLADRLKDGRYVLGEEALGELEAYIDDQRSSPLPSPRAAEQQPHDSPPAEAPAAAIAGPTDGAYGDRRVEGGPAAFDSNRKRRQASDLGSVTWRKPAARGNPAATARPRPLEPDTSSATHTAPAPAPNPDEAAFGIASLMNRERRDS